MKFRGNIMLQYSLVTFGVVAAISVLLSVTLSRQLTDYQIRSHIRLYPEIVRLTAKDDARVSALFSNGRPSAVSPELEGLFGQFLHLGNIFRVKVWSRDAVILWSDQRDLIGQSFPDNDGLQDALAGEESYEVARPDKRENVDESAVGSALEIYTPVLTNEEVAGVIELYEANRDLFSQIARTTRFVWVRSSTAGVALYALLFAVFAQAWRRQKKTSAQLEETQDVTIFALAYQAELRDQQTGRHLERTAIYVRLLAESLVRLPQYRSYMTESYIGDLVKSAPLHDIGKVGVRDSVLLKPGQLTEEEREEIKKHCEYGARVLQRAEKKLQFQSFLSIAIQLALYHHEQWDGRGYPQGLTGDQIPISGRIMAVADNYDALRTERVYKKPFPHDECLALIRAESGRRFDPKVTEAFLERAEEFRKVSEELADE